MEMGLEVTDTVTYHTVITGEDDSELLRMFDEGSIMPLRSLVPQP